MSFLMTRHFIVRVYICYCPRSQTLRLYTQLFLCKISLCDTKNRVLTCTAHFFLVPGEPVAFAVTDYTLLDSSFAWSPPNRTNGIITNYTLVCIPEKSYLPNCTETTKSHVYIQGQNFSEVSRCLERGLNYECTLDASNDAGSGPSTSTQLVESVLQ